MYACVGLDIPLLCSPAEGLPWYKPISGELWAMMTAGAVCLVVFVLSISFFICRKFGKARTSKGPM